MDSPERAQKAQSHELGRYLCQKCRSAERQAPARHEWLSFAAKQCSALLVKAGFAPRLTRTAPLRLSRRFCRGFPWKTPESPPLGSVSRTFGDPSPDIFSRSPTFFYLSRTVGSASPTFFYSSPTVGSLSPTFFRGSPPRGSLSRTFFCRSRLVGSLSRTIFPRSPELFRVSPTLGEGSRTSGRRSRLT